MDLDYLRWCNERLTGPEFATYCILRAIGPAVMTQPEIAEIACRSKQAINDHMINLQKKGFILYQSIGWAGCDILWIRQTPIDSVPDYRHSLVAQYRWRLKNHDSGETVTLKHGDVAEFARQYKLRADSVRYLLRGQKAQYKGWAIAE